MAEEIIRREIVRRLLLKDIERGRTEEQELLRLADNLSARARQKRAQTEGLVAKLAQFDRGGT